MQPPKTVELSAGPLQVRDSGGTGEPVLLVHGLLVDGRLWDAVTPLLEAEGLRVVVPDLPLGAHKTAMRPDAPLAPPDIARLLGELAESLGLTGVTLVGNDTGGAICQMAAAPRPELARAARPDAVRRLRELLPAAVPAAGGPGAPRAGAGRRWDAAVAARSRAPLAAVRRLDHQARHRRSDLQGPRRAVHERQGRPPRHDQGARRRGQGGHDPRRAGAARVRPPGADRVGRRRPLLQAPLRRTARCGHPRRAPRADRRQLRLHADRPAAAHGRADHRPDPLDSAGRR